VAAQQQGDEEMKRIVFYLLVLFLSFFFTFSFCGESSAAVLPFDVLSLYSAVNAFYDTSASSDSFYDVVLGTTQTSLSRSFDFGVMNGSQSGMISVIPAQGVVTVSGSSSTFIDQAAQPGRYRSDGRHVVLGSFVVPDVGDARTDIFLDIEVQEATNAGLLFGVFNEEDWNPTLFQPDVHLSEGIGGVYTDRQFTYSFIPGQRIYFALGIQPGVGVHLLGSFDEDFTDSDSVSGSFSWSFAGTPVSEAPVCSSTVTTIPDLMTEVETLETSSQTISVLNNTLDNVQEALGKGKNRTARNRMKNFIDKVVNRSNLKESNHHGIGLDQANSLLCGAANVLIGIELP